MITNEVVNKGIDYIASHLNEKITLEDVSSYCHFSKFYFSRVFKAETGESVYSFIKRLKIERSSIRVSSQRDESITDIAYEFGYSPSNFSSAFKDQLEVSPATFRKNRETLLSDHPFMNTKITYHEFEYYDRKIEVKHFENMDVLYKRYLGNYKDISQHWRTFLDEYSKYHKDNTLYIERSYDDPSITETDRCIYDICMTVDDDCPENNKTTIIGGKFIVFKYEGTNKQIFEAYQGIFNIWFPKSNYTLDDRIGFDIYRFTDTSNDFYKLDICIPVR